MVSAISVLKICFRLSVKLSCARLVYESKTRSTIRNLFIRFWLFIYSVVKFYSPKLVFFWRSYGVGMVVILDKTPKKPISTGPFRPPLADPVYQRLPELIGHPYLNNDATFREALNYVKQPHLEQVNLKWRELINLCGFSSQWFVSSMLFVTNFSTELLQSF